MRVTDVRCHVLLDPGYDAEATSSNQDTIVVEVHTDEAITGIGETDLNAWVARACIEAPGTHTMDRGLKALLIGMDVGDPRACWDVLYRGTAMTGRRGTLMHALGAIDIALWDIAGKAEGRPVRELLGETRATPLRPYASLLPNTGSTWEDFAETLAGQAIAAAERGYRAAKLEILTTGPYRHTGLSMPDGRMVDIIAAVRAAVGDDFEIMVDVGYAWDDWRTALAVIETWAPYDVFFVETPIWTDDIDGYAELARRAPMPIAAGEWLSSHCEFEEYARRGALQVLQPDMGRVGGLTEAMRVAGIARRDGLAVVPHGWKTGLTVAATAHFASVTPELPFFEFVPPEVAESRLRRELVDDELTLQPDGTLPFPVRPGLGVELNVAAVEEFAAAARAIG